MQNLSLQIPFDVRVFELSEEKYLPFYFKN